MGNAAARNLIYLSILFLLLLIVMALSLSIGSMNISLGKIAEVLFSPADGYESKVIWDIRLPRILTALAVGGGLSVAGAVFQAMLMNPLAEPYILGVSSGGTFGAVLAMLIGMSFWGVQSFAFLGSVSVIFLVFMLGKRFGSIEPNVLLLTGVMVGAFFSAMILLIITFLNESLRSAIFWLMGNLTNANQNNVYVILTISILVSVFLSLNAQKFNVLSLGDENAAHLGINISLFRNVIYIITSLMVGALVSVSGIIGFVGLIIPHACRMIFGTDNRLVLPASYFIGASFLIAADIIARTIISPSEIPVGAITAVIGAPVFIYLIRKRFKFSP